MRTVLVHQYLTLQGWSDDSCKAICENTEPRFRCKCPVGYDGDGVTECHQVNECLAKIHECDIRLSILNGLEGYKNSNPFKIRDKEENIVSIQLVPMLV